MSARAPVAERLTPVERLETLCDPASLEIFSNGNHSVIGGSGRIAGRPVVCYAQDGSQAGGAVGAAEADVIVRALRMARDEGAQLVGFLESAGARIQEGVAALDGFGRIFSENVSLSGTVPQVSVITGTAAGGGCYSPALTDFVVMTEESSMFLTGPKVVREALGEDVTASLLGGTRVHERNGVCHFVTPGDHEAIGLTRDLLGYLPRRRGEPPPEAPSGTADHEDVGALVPREARSCYDVRAVIRALVDSGEFLEVSPRWARNIVIGFARLEGRAVGVVANQPRYLGGVIDVDASQKAARFVETCSAFRVPLVVLVDTPGFMPGMRQEAAGVIRHGADLLRAFAGATVPRVTVILRKAFGGAYITMNSKGLGANAAFVWPGAEIGIMGPRSAVQLIHQRRLRGMRSPERAAARLARRYARTHLSPDAALRLGVVDAVVEPARTREVLVSALAR
jgi:acetyl-CoA carboxylase carboxyltransferase component